jgi:hypothetical protein
MTRYEALLEQNQDQILFATDRAELMDLRIEGNRFMFSKLKPQPSFAGVVSHSSLIITIAYQENPTS